MKLRLAVGRVREEFGVGHESTLAGVLGAIGIAALLLAGCSSPDPTPAVSGAATPIATLTPTATPTPMPTPTAIVGGQEAPRSEGEAIEAATVALQRYVDIRTEIEVEHPADSSSIDGIAMGEAADNVHSIASYLAENGTITQGTYALDVTTAYANDLTASDGTVYPFSHAHFEGCFSSEGISATNKDGTPAEMNDYRRGAVQASVYYLAAESQWILADLRSAGEGNVPC
jgi:hypothetical protein